MRRCYCEVPQHTYPVAERYRQVPRHARPPTARLAVVRATSYVSTSSLSVGMRVFGGWARDRSRRRDRAHGLHHQGLAGVAVLRATCYALARAAIAHTVPPRRPAVQLTARPPGRSTISVTPTKIASQGRHDSRLASLTCRPLESRDAY